MAKHSIPLSRVKVAAPCPADWAAMTGNDRVRFCGQCQLNVYNLSAMTKNEAEALIQRMEGHLCVRYYQRTDGTILTKNCPVGLKAIKQRVSRVASAAISALLSLFAGISAHSLYSSSFGKTNNVVMGAIALPPPPIVETLPPLQNPSITPPIGCGTNNNGNGEGNWIIGKSPIMGRIASRPQVVRRSEGVLRGMAVVKVDPAYPPLAHTAHISGDVQVEVTIDEEGSVTNSKIITGHSILQKAAQEAAEQWRFSPVLINGSPVKVQGILTFRFSN